MAHIQHAETGDLIVIRGHHVGEPRRTGQILDVWGEAPHEHFRVRWEDGHEGIFYPGSDATLQRVEHPEDEPVLVHEP